MKFLDGFLNSITMYRLVLYYLIILVAIAATLGFFGIIHLNPLSLLVSVAFLIIISWIVNKIFAFVFKVTPNVESVYISALILALIISPSQNLSGIPILFWAAVWSVAGKFIFTYKMKHLFNPAALAVFLTAIFLGQSATWWVGTAPMLIPVAIGGFLIARKIQRVEMVLTFILAVAIATFSLHLDELFFYTPVIFFATVMFTEPLTTPPTKNLRLVYALLTGYLFFRLTPEQALLIGNLFAFLSSPKERLILSLQEKIQTAPDSYDFVFAKTSNFNFQPGQYLEWTLGHQNPDSRGNRRYFTLASSPTENNFRIGVKFNEPASSFKKKLLSLNPGDQISASQLTGDFLLPKDQNKKLIFIAGGIGITPFRSMIKYLIDHNQNRSIVLLYANKSAEDIVYQDVFNTAEKIGLKTVYLTGRFGAETIQKEIPDYKDQTFYLSGPHAMVQAYEKMLSELKLPRRQIKIDYFPGFA